MTFVMNPTKSHVYHGVSEAWWQWRTNCNLVAGDGCVFWGKTHGLFVWVQDDDMGQFCCWLAWMLLKRFLFFVIEVFIIWHITYLIWYMRIFFATTHDTICYHTLQTQGNPSNCWWNVSWPRHHCFRISKGFGIDQSPKGSYQVNHEQEIQRRTPPAWVSFIRDVILPWIRHVVDFFTIGRYIVPGRGAWIKWIMVVPLGFLPTLFSRAPLGWTARVPSEGTKVPPFSLWITLPMVSPTRILLAKKHRDVFEMLHDELFVRWLWILDMFVEGALSLNYPLHFVLGGHASIKLIECSGGIPYRLSGLYPNLPYL